MSLRRFTQPITAHPLVIPLLVLLASVTMSVGYLQLPGKWWYEDDPIQYYYQYLRQN